MASDPITTLDRDEVQWAREMPRSEKLIAGARLFDYAVSLNVAQIRKQNPQATDEEIVNILRQRLEWAAQWDDA